MYARVLVLIVVFTAIAVAMLALRQQRYETMHEMAVLHQKLNDNRQDLWHWQSRIAERMEPGALREALDRAGLKLEPVVGAKPATAVVRLNDE